MRARRNLFLPHFFPGWCRKSWPEVDFLKLVAKSALNKLLLTTLKTLMAYLKENFFSVPLFSRIFPWNLGWISLLQGGAIEGVRGGPCPSNPPCFAALLFLLLLSLLRIPFLFLSFFPSSFSSFVWREEPFLSLRKREKGTWYGNRHDVNKCWICIFSLLPQRYRVGLKNKF